MEEKITLKGTLPTTSGLANPRLFARFHAANT